VELPCSCTELAVTGLDMSDELQGSHKFSSLVQYILEYGEEKNLLPLPGIEPQSSSPVAIPTELSQVHKNICTLQDCIQFYCISLPINKYRIGKGILVLEVISYLILSLMSISLLCIIY
jgi:hypothetical protein